MKLGLEPAFANNNTNGMSKRFYAVCVAMQGMLANEEMLKRMAFRAELNHIQWQEVLIENSYILADELLKQEASEG